MTSGAGTGMACDPVLVTGWVDGALSEAVRAAVEAHVAGCETCRAQAAAEREISAAVRALPRPALPHGLADRVRRRARRPVALRRRVWVPALAAVLAVALWIRGAPQFVSWELALDHGHCFGKQQVPAQVFTADPMRLAAWYEAKGVEIPMVPAAAGGLDLVGGRFCRIADRRVVHVYYGGTTNQQLSIYVVPGSVRFERSHLWSRGGLTVNLIRVAGDNVAIVSPSAPAIDAFRKSFERTVADAGPR